MVSSFDKIKDFLKNKVDLNKIKDDINYVNKYIKEDEKINKSKDFIKDNILNKNNLKENLNSINENYLKKINLPSLKNNNQNTYIEKEIFTKSENGKNYYYQNNYHYYKEENTEKPKSNWNFFKYFRKEKKIDRSFFHSIFSSKLFVKSCILVSLGCFSLSFGKQFAKSLFKKEEIKYQIVQKTD